jgi:hypothetical protein
MTHAPSRSMNADLNQGSVDGKYKQVVRDRGGIGANNSETVRARMELNDVWYGIHEQQVKIRPDGKPVHTPNYVSAPSAQAGF